MSTEDQIRMEVLSVDNKVNALSTRVNELMAEVIKGRTDLVERIDHLADEIAALKGLVVEMPKIIVEAMAEATKGRTS